MAASVGFGDLLAWQGFCLLLGKAVRIIPRHSHQAIQVVWGYSGPVGLRGGDEGPWTSYPLGIVPSRQPHSMDATATTYNAIIFVEPETAAGRAITERYLQRGVASVDDAATVAAGAALFAAWLAHAGRPALIAGAERVIATLTGDLPPVRITDERIMRATEYIRDHLTGRIALEEVAAHVFLSPSRFRHLFVSQTGMGLRPYVLWRRFVLAWELLAKGESLSNAAHGAGFADSAHFTRTSRQMFGFPPSLMRVDAGAEARQA